MYRRLVGTFNFSSMKHHLITCDSSQTSTRQKQMLLEETKEKSLRQYACTTRTYLRCHWQPIQSHQATHASSANRAVGPCSALGSNASQHVVLHCKRRVPRVLRLEGWRLRQLLLLWLHLWYTGRQALLRRSRGRIIPLGTDELIGSMRVFTAQQYHGCISRSSI